MKNNNNVDEKIIEQQVYRKSLILVKLRQRELKSRNNKRLKFSYQHRFATRQSKKLDKKIIK